MFHDEKHESRSGAGRGRYSGQQAIARVLVDEAMAIATHVDRRRLLFGGEFRRPDTRRLRGR